MELEDLGMEDIGGLFAEALGGTSLNDIRDLFSDRYDYDVLLKNQKKLRVTLDAMPRAEALASLSMTTMFYLLADALGIDEALLKDQEEPINGND